MVSGPFLIRRDRHLGFAIYKGNMNTQFPTIDANISYGVTRSSNDYTLSASPSFSNHASNYVHRPIQSNLHASSSYDTSNMHHMYSNSHASATPQVDMPMNNMMGLANQFEHNEHNVSASPSFCWKYALEAIII